MLFGARPLRIHKGLRPPPAAADPRRATAKGSQRSPSRSHLHSWAGPGPWAQASTRGSQGPGPEGGAPEGGSSRVPGLTGGRQSLAGGWGSRRTTDRLRTPPAPGPLRRERRPHPRGRRGPRTERVGRPANYLCPRNRRENNQGLWRRGGGETPPASPHTRPNFTKH